MRYSLGTNLADFGFSFFEKIHQPIFLLHRLGQVTKMNEAGRKLLRIARLNSIDLEAFARKQLVEMFSSGNRTYKRVQVGRSGLHLIARKLKDSEFILVEVRH